MPAYKNELTNTWEISFYYVDWTGKRKRKHKRNFRTKKEALEYERSFKVKIHCSRRKDLIKYNCKGSCK